MRHARTEFESGAAASTAGAFAVDELEIRKSVRAHYADRVEGCCGSTSGSSCGPELVQVDSSAPESLAGIPRLGVGDPMERLAPREGEIILDLGSGPGRDVLYAGEKVGPSGLALGVDATPEMVFRSRETARSLGRANVEFRLGEIEHLPVETATVDGISSDCVVNLSPDKARVFREAFRVLKPGGRLVLSDVVAERDVAPEVRQDLDRWAACEAGAVTLSEYESLLRQAGFEDLRSEILGTYREGVLARAVVIGRKPKAA